MNILLLQEQEFDEFKKEGASFIELSNTHDISATTFWETAKVVMRWKIISYSTYKHGKEKELERELEKLKKLHHECTQKQDEQVITEIHQIKYPLDNILSKK